MDLDYLYDRARRQTSPSIDFDALVADCRARSTAMIAQWRARFPGTEVAVLETVIEATGHTKRRLRRYRELSQARHGTPGLLVIRELTSFDEILNLKMVQYRAAAARADVDRIQWRFLSVAEALETAPP